MGDHNTPPESRIQYIVKDKPTENGVKINNVLTGLLLAAALWVGSSVEDLKGAVVILATEQAHVVADLGESLADIDDNTKRIVTLERLHPEFYMKKDGTEWQKQP